MHFERFFLQKHEIIFCLILLRTGVSLNGLIILNSELRYMVKSQEQIPREQMAHLQRKLDHCRNQENNPESEV